VLARVRLTPSHRSTGNTRHFLPSGPMPLPVELQIAQYPGDSGFYLFYLDEHGEVMTDTYHDTLERALGQGEWEFSVAADEWERS